MAASKRSDQEVLAALTGLFRSHGYEGTSLARIMDATGLVKASLYHRFPQGKEEMAAAVLADVGAAFVADVLKPLTGSGEPAARVQATAKRLRSFYEGGGQACLLETMTLDSGTPAIQSLAKQSIEFWIASFAAIAKEAGVPAAQAKQRAEDAVVAIEGALVVARVSGSRQAFARALERLPEQLLSPVSGQQPVGEQGLQRSRPAAPAKRVRPSLKRA